jgi:segregation and condensation protein B
MNRLGQRLAAIAARSSNLLPVQSRASLSRPMGKPWRTVAFALRSATPEWPEQGRQLSRRGRVEAVLFLAREPLTLRKLAQLANLTDGTEARTLIGSLVESLDRRGCAFQVAQVAGGYQLLSRPEFAPWLRAQGGRDEPVRLSPPALETLAVVAYRQPVLRAEVESVRGVACGEILRQLLDRDLLRIAGRSEELGRPLWYGTTRRFLQTFGLRSLDELPWAGLLRRPMADSAVQSNSISAASGAGLTADIDAA